jgi:hypothetical protein
VSILVRDASQQRERRHASAKRRETDIIDRTVKE